ncbi:hypothetical protein CAPTEDRAFT_113077 [Capitella teleta]|uniref:G-protein coupled receptors family 1 profile domain-containing protein n=1 Tax=Capitella teleta TaxID=283909 RepID=R7T3T2_CAPTE|nr:hypothetical protein CAPTEDRAFT_113077 [Capitella teleta]|eukprot:ELT87477.1 hypothetical protein CAPTEDRAFT_113077 [Capitella teleta]
MTTDSDSTIFTFDDDNSKHTSITAQETIKILYYCIGTVGFLGNLMVVVIIGTSKSMRKTTTNRFIMHQSCCDGTVAVILMLSTLFEDDGRKLSGIADEIYCRLWLTKTFLWGSLVTSTYNLVTMTLERYLSIVHPILHKNRWNKKVFIACICMVWVLGFGYNLAFMVPSTVIIGGDCNLYYKWPSVETQQGQGIFTIVFQFFIPLIVLIVCYSRMALILKGKIQPTDDANNKASKNMARARRNVIKTLILVGVSFVLCWIWNQILFVLFNLGFPVNFNGNFYHFTVVAVFCNCCINPFIYIIKYEQFQRKLIRFRGMCFRNDQPLQSELSNSVGYT